MGHTHTTTTARIGIISIYISGNIDKTGTLTDPLITQAHVDHVKMSMRPLIRPYDYWYVKYLVDKF